MKIVCIGHSIVNGYPFEREYSFPDIMNRELQPGSRVINYGVNGESTDEIMYRFSGQAASAYPDIIFLMAGTNDFIYRTGTPEDVFSYSMKMQQISDEAGIKLVHMTPIDINIDQAARTWPATTAEDYHRVKAEMLRFTELLREAAGRGEIEIIDSYGEYFQYNKFIDGIHPTKDGQKLLAVMCMRYLADHEPQEEKQ